MNPLVAHQPQSHRKQSSTSSLKYEPGPSSEHRRKEPEHQQGEPTPFFLSYTQVYHQSTHWRGNSTPSLTKQIKLGTKHVIWPGRSSHQTIVTLLKDLKHEQLMIVCCVEDIPLSIPLELERRWTPSSLTKQIPAWPGKNLLHSSFGVGFGYLKGRDKMQVQVASIR